MQTMLEGDGLHEGVYNDLGGNTTAQTGWRDPATLAATAVGAARLLWRLPVLLVPCADDGCETEYRTYEMAVRRFDPAKATQQFNDLTAKGIKLTDHALKQAQERGISTQRIANTLQGRLMLKQDIDDGQRQSYSVDPEYKTFYTQLGEPVEPGKLQHIAIGEQVIADVTGDGMLAGIWMFDLPAEIGHKFAIKR